MKFFIFTILLALHINVFAADFMPSTSFDYDRLARIEVEIRHLPAEGQKIVLVLGDTPPKTYAPLPNHFKFNSSNGFEIEPYVVYMGLWEEDCSAQNFIHADFNELELLSYMNSVFGSVFDLITVDWSVRKFMDCTKEQIRSFMGMLKPHGFMMFDNDPDTITSLTTESAIRDLIEDIPARYQEIRDKYLALTAEEKVKQRKRYNLYLDANDEIKLPAHYINWVKGGCLRTNYEELKSSVEFIFKKDELQAYPKYVQHNRFSFCNAPAEEQIAWKEYLPLTAEMKELCDNSYVEHIAKWAKQLAEIATIETLFCKPPYLSETRYDEWQGEFTEMHFIKITKK